MINYFVRLAKRFAVLLPGPIIAYLAVRDILPPLDKRLPVALAIFITYLVTAYVLIPAFLRLLRVIFPVRHLPLYCTTPDGFASDPLNIGVIATRKQLVAAMRQAGWCQADRHTLATIIRQILSALVDRPYPNMPVSNLYLLGRRQDISFERPAGDKRGHRHHVRFWATTFDTRQPLAVRTIHWRKPRQTPPPSSRLLWLGAATLDVGFAPIRHNFQITHMIDPDTNKERELIADQLDQTGQIQQHHKLQLTNHPYKLVNRAWRGYLSTDGVMTVCELTAPE